MTRRVLFYVQHLLGIGHFVRAMRIARALAAGPFEVDLVMGGSPVAGLDAGRARLVQLPPVRAGAGGFSELVDADGALLTEAAKAMRRDALLAHFDAFAPDILLIEAFPFGRRQMRFELLPLLERAHGRAARPLIACSVRDILQQERRPGRAENYCDLVERWFDLVLVHGDPALAAFGESFALADRISGKTRYTGLVGPGVLERAAEVHDVIVSAGGGAVGHDLIRAALRAKPLTRLADARWLVATGPNATDGFVRELEAPGVTVARFLPDLPQRMMNAQVSISQAGYNTVADLLAARCKAVLVPYSAGGETEQTQRAGLMERRGLAVVAQADAVSLARAVDAVLDVPEAFAGIETDGARRTGEILSEILTSARSA